MFVDTRFKVGVFQKVEGSLWMFSWPWKVLGGLKVLQEVPGFIEEAVRITEVVLGALQKVPGVTDYLEKIGGRHATRLTV